MAFLKSIKEKNWFYGGKYFFYLKTLNNLIVLKEKGKEDKQDK